MRTNHYRFMVYLGLLLMWVLGAMPAAAQTTVTVACGDEAGIVSAINTANTGPNAVIIELEAMCTYVYDSPASVTPPAALPVIRGTVTINGNGATIERDSSVLSDFGLISVGAGGNLTITNLQMKHGRLSNDYGGAIYVNGAGATLMMVNGLLVSNSAPRGGGLAVDNGTATVIGSWFDGNSATSFGGAIHIWQNGTLNLYNTYVMGNSAAVNAGGIASLGTLSVVNSTIVKNTGGSSGGMQIGAGTASITNSILWDNASAQIEAFIPISVTYSDVQGGYTGTGNVDVNPLFTAPDATSPFFATDFNLLPNSPVQNIGSNAALPADVYDLDDDLDFAEAIPFDREGNARVYLDVVDMGADELVAPLNRVVNGSFEQNGSTVSRALSWSNVKTRTSDKRLCDTPSKPLTASTGDCVFNFSGGTSLDASTRGIKQVINSPSWLAVGDVLNLSAMVEASKFKSGAVVILQVGYADNTKAKVTTAIPTGTYAFTALTAAPLTVTKPVSKVTVYFKIGRAGGRLRIDDAVLNVTTSSIHEFPDTSTSDPLSFPDATESSTRFGETETGFEGGLGLWKKVSPTNTNFDDKRRCDATAFEGSCYFRFKGRPDEDSRLILTVPQSEIPTGHGTGIHSVNDALRIALHYRTGAAQPRIAVKVRVFFSDGTPDLFFGLLGQSVGESFGPTGGYDLEDWVRIYDDTVANYDAVDSDGIVLEGLPSPAVRRIRVLIRHETNSAKIDIDNIRLEILPDEALPR